MIGDASVDELRAALDRCANCRYARRAGALEHGMPVIGQEVYVCRRYPPKLVVVVAGGTAQVTPMHPPVQAADCCGEFSVKPTAGN